jgi:hypothetical protein
MKTMQYVHVFLSPPADSPDEKGFRIYGSVEFSRVPCVGECIAISKNLGNYQVVSVCHVSPAFNPPIVAEVWAVEVEHWLKTVDVAAAAARRQNDYRPTLVD